MKLIATAILGAGLALGLGAQAQAAIAVQPLQTEAAIIKAYGGCGPMGHRGPYGGCRPGGQYGGYRYGRACPPGFHLGPYGRRCRPNFY